MKKLVLSYFLIIYISISGFCQVMSQDTSSLQYKMDKAISTAIRSQKPVVFVKFYKDGKRLKNYTLYTVKNDTIEKNNKDSINIAPGFNSKDSISFEIRYKKSKITSPVIFIKRLRYGGKIVAGIVTNFTDEINKYRSDSSKYFQENQENHLDFITRDLIEKNLPEIEKGYQLNYFFIEDNIIGYNYGKYEFVKPKGS